MPFLVCTEEWAPGHLVLRSLVCVESNGRCTTFTPEEPQNDQRTKQLKHLVRRWLKKGKAQGFVTVPFSSALSNFG